MLIKGEFLATINISLYLPLQCNTKLHPALKAWVVFFDIEYFKAFIENHKLRQKIQKYYIEWNNIKLEQKLELFEINKMVKFRVFC